VSAVRGGRVYRSKKSGGAGVPLLCERFGVLRVGMLVIILVVRRCRAGFYIYRYHSIASDGINISKTKQVVRYWDFHECLIANDLFASTLRCPSLFPASLLFTGPWPLPSASSAALRQNNLDNCVT
jgi:hypothetical protein